MNEYPHKTLSILNRASQERTHLDKWYLTQAGCFLVCQGSLSTHLHSSFIPALLQASMLYSSEASVPSEGDKELHLSRALIRPSCNLTEHIHSLHTVYHKTLIMLYSFCGFVTAGQEFDHSLHKIVR